jgi:hypothetical protein
MTLRESWEKALPLVLMLVLATPPAAAQTVLPTTEDDWFVRLQVEKPFLADDDDFAPISSILDTDVVVRWSSNVFLQVGIPLAIAQRDFVDGTSAYIGNLRGNFLFGEPGELRAFLGVTIPTASNISGPDLALEILGLPLLDEEEAWAPDVFSFRGGFVPAWQLSEGVTVGMRLGGALAIPTDFETLWLYARPTAWGRVSTGTVELRADLATSYFANSEGASLDEKSVAYLDLRAAVAEAPGRPELFVRLPLDGQARAALDFAVGLAVRF